MTAPQIAEQLNRSLAGRYVVQREIGRGGTAIVYLAQDVRHDRLVAVKVLNPELGELLGPTRFLSEIRVTANLQHPNLLPLFDSGEADGLLFYVMPYVEAASLRDRLAHERQLPIDEAVRIAVSVAAALEYAHAQNVIHRDLKPENILLQAGQPIVADFGIALAVSRAVGARITQTGISLGTPHYMSPEQATGDRVVDRRSDVYSLAAVLHEMLTGDPPHTGDTAQAVIAKLLTEKPVSVQMRRPNVPAHVADAIAVGLEKLPADRWPSAHAFANAITDAHRAVTPRGRAFSVPRWTNVLLQRRAMRVATLAGVASVAAGVVIAASPRSRSQAQPLWFDLVLPDSVAPGLSDGNSIAMSPDGSLVAYIGAASRALFVRPLVELSPRRLAGTEGAECPSFSPDGRWIVFTSRGHLKKVPVGGGTPISIADSAGTCSVWTDRNEILFDLNGELFRVSADGGPMVIVTRRDTARRIGNMRPTQALPGGESALIDVSEGFSFDFQVGLVSLPDGHVTKLTSKNGVPRFGAQYANGYIAFVQGSDRILAAPFSQRTRRFTGPTVTLLDTLVDFSMANNGSLAYQSSVPSIRSLVAVSRNGGMRLLAPPAQDSQQRASAWLDGAYFSWPRLSPDGRRIAIEMRTGPFSWDIWVYDIDSRTLSRLTSNYSGSRPSGWTADGHSVVFMAIDSANQESPSRVVSQVWDGSAPPHELMRLPARVHDVTVGPPHGYAVSTRIYTDKPSDIWITPLDTPQTFRLLVASAAGVGEPRLSRDGKLLAYVGIETGRSEVYVRPLHGPSSRLQVSAGGGKQPVWSADGRLVYYRTTDSPGYMMRATISSGPKFRVVRRDTLFRDVFAQHNFTNYDVFPGGNELLMIHANPITMRPAVILNWPELLRQRAALRELQ